MSSRQRWIHQRGHAIPTEQDGSEEDGLVPPEPPGQAAHEPQAQQLGQHQLRTVQRLELPLQMRRYVLQAYGTWSTMEERLGAQRGDRPTSPCRAVPSLGPYPPSRPPSRATRLRPRAPGSAAMNDVRQPAGQARRRHPAPTRCPVSASRGPASGRPDPATNAAAPLDPIGAARAVPRTQMAPKAGARARPTRPRPTQCRASRAPSASCCPTARREDRLSAGRLRTVVASLTSEHSGAGGDDDEHGCEGAGTGRVVGAPGTPAAGEPRWCRVVEPRWRI
jgi:hypothetical protein